MIEKFSEDRQAGGPAGRAVASRLPAAAPLSAPTGTPQSAVPPAAEVPPGVEISESELAECLAPIRGFALAQAIFAAFELGIFDEIALGPGEIREVAASLSLEPERFDGLLDYLENETVVVRSGTRVELTPRGQQLRAARPWYELLVGGYSGTFASLAESLRAGAPFATRNGARVAVGSCGISQHDALPMVLKLMQHLERPSAIIDLGCGDGTFIAQVAAAYPDVPCAGVEPDEGARMNAQQRAAAAGISNVQIFAGDALHPPAGLADTGPGVCFITAFVLQEVLEQSGERAVIDLLQRSFEADPDASWLVIEVDRRHPLAGEPSQLALSYYNPYYLLHRVTQQRLLPVSEWKRLYAAAGLCIAAEVLPNPEYDSLGIKFGHLLRRRDSTQGGDPCGC
jgi:2-ketoarginine methyltransferase